VGQGDPHAIAELCVGLDFKLWSRHGKDSSMGRARAMRNKLLGFSCKEVDQAKELGVCAAGPSPTIVCLSR